MSRVDIKRDTPLPDTHLTELQLTELWYDYQERMLGNSRPRQQKWLFPRSRKDLIQFFTQQDLRDGPR